MALLKKLKESVSPETGLGELSPETDGFGGYFWLRVATHALALVGTTDLGEAPQPGGICTSSLLAPPRARCGGCRRKGKRHFGQQLGLSFGHK